MDDEEIIALFWRRQERAVKETQRKYGSFLTGIAARLLFSREDREETVNDTYLRVWNAIPTDRPTYFAGYLAKILRRLCVDRIRRNGAEKRGGNEYALSLDELEECVPGGGDPAENAQLRDLTEAIERFLENEDPVKRRMFLQRYFYAAPLADIAAENGLTLSNTKVILSRLREKLKGYLTEEGYR